MRLARRGLLGMGAAVAASMLTSACREDPGTPSATSTATPSSPATSPSGGSVSPSGFPWPAEGSVYYGASVPDHRSLPAWESELGSPLALNRSYFTPDSNELAQLIERCHLDLASGRLPHVSIKPPGTWQAVAAGDHDEWLRSMLGLLGEEDAGVLFTLHHEPENDAGPPGMGAPDFVAMQSRVIALAAELAPRVVVTPVLQHWTFDPLRDDIDPASWVVPDAAVMGLDVYNPWSPTNGKPWRTFGSKVEEAIAWFGDAPLVIGEYGCRNDPDNPGLAAEWLRDAADYARTHGVVSMSYYNSGVDSPDGSWTLAGEAEDAFAELLASDWVARLS